MIRFTPCGSNKGFDLSAPFCFDLMNVKTLQILNECIVLKVISVFIHNGWNCFGGKNGFTHGQN